MRIIIVGAGAVGSIVANRLSSANHDVVMIEADPAIVNEAKDHVDAMIRTGNGAACEVLEEAGVERAGVLIAVTDVDEINILACLQADRYGVRTKVARVRNREYYRRAGEEDTTGQSSFEAIDQMINPDQEAVAEIHELLLQPAATDIYDFADGRVQVIGARIGAGAPVDGKSLSEIAGEVGSRWALVAAITRRQKTIIPTGDDKLLEGDHVFLVGRPGRINEALGKLTRPTPRPRAIMVAGANRIGVSLSEWLARDGIHVKLIEPDEQRARWAGDRLEKTLPLRGEATDAELLEQEGVEKIDAFVAVSDDEEMNITSCLLARHYGASKTISLIKRPNYVPLAAVIGIDAAVSPRLSTARAIMRYFRHGNVLSLTDLKDSDAEVLEVEATERSAAVGVQLARLELPRNTILGAIIKPYQVVIPRGSDVIEPGDKVLVFTLPGRVKAVQKLFR